MKKLSKYALKQLTEEERKAYYEELAMEEKTIYGDNGVRVEIYRHGNGWMIDGYDPDDYQDMSDIADTPIEALEIGNNMLHDLNDQYADYDDEWQDE